MEETEARKKNRASRVTAQQKLMCHTSAKIPRRSSPKLPHPIFFPTRKFGPTINTFDDDVVTGLFVPAVGGATGGDAVFTAAIPAS